uniref:Lysosomal membrane ascorbate-dependent ferrireductase CYB561A3 n=1 Tax=Homo sapiens TaxID=9606 RepID=B4DLM2_HUMAN|nr:unnamed protein product [Homo sapiens]
MVSGRFYLSCLLLGSLGSMCILFTIYWMQYWRGGFAWNGSIYMFNWHPVLMVAGMVVFYGGASLVYRLPSEAVFANSTGMLVVAFGLLVLYILLASSWKRPEPGILTDRQPLLHDGE